MPGAPDIQPRNVVVPEREQDIAFVLRFGVLFQIVIEKIPNVPFSLSVVYSLVFSYPLSPLYGL